MASNVYVLDNTVDGTFAAEIRQRGSAVDAASASSTGPSLVNGGGGRGGGSSPAQAHVGKIPIGVYGGAKSCLYCSVLLLSALAIVNIGLLLYVAETLEFNFADRGIGPMHFEHGPDAVRVDGNVRLAQGLATSSIAAPDDGAPLTIEAQGGVSIKASAALESPGNPDPRPSAVHLGDGGVEIQADTLTYSSGEGEVLHASKELFRVGAAKTEIESASGITVKGALETNTVRNDYARAKTLTVESLGQDLHVRATNDVTVHSSHGDVHVAAGGGHGVHVRGSTITFNSTHVEVPAAVSNARRVEVAGAAGQTAQGGALCICGPGTAAPGRVFSVFGDTTCAKGARTRADAAKAKSTPCD